MGFWLYIIFTIFVFILIIIAFNINRIFKKYNRKILSKKMKYTIVLFLLVIFFGLIEYWAHFHDEYKILKNKIALPYIILSFLPFENSINYDNINVKLPYGYSKINEYSAIAVFGSLNKIFYLNKHIHNEYLEQFGSAWLWFMDYEKYVFMTQIKRGGIYYLYFNTIDNNILY